ncbi:MAG TPA: hypothetical protein VEY33_04820 [Gemmatimonadota bacterium]|nr:hypothetical protein [Gemmatimonadota bacterium]
MGDPWREGKYVDLWSVVHLLAGILLSSLLFRAGLSLFGAVAITLAALAGYEVVEKLAAVEEHATNRIVDILFGLGGLGVVHEIAEGDLAWSIFSAATTAFALLNYLGWQAWRKREGKL